MAYARPLSALFSGDSLRNSSPELSGSLPEGLIAPAGTARSGAPTPPLRRLSEGPAARQRMRDLVAQTGAFVSDPEGSLPHDPLWDMNRGFGP